MTINAKERLIVALDLADINAARAMVAELDGVVDFFKIGLTLQLAEGAEGFIQELLKSHKRVFLDYKYYDIPETVRQAVKRAAEVGGNISDSARVKRDHKTGSERSRYWQFETQP
jgi:orotidine-5'-phosphate decarboxylase